MIKTSTQIEVLRNAIPFVIGAAERDTLVETAEHDGSAGSVDRFNPPHCPARHQDARDPRKHEYQCNARDHGCLDLIGKAVELADILPTSRRSPLGNVSSIARSSGRFVALGNGSGARNSVHPLAAVTVDGHTEVATQSGQ